MSKEEASGEWQVASDDNPSLEWPVLPTETEIYILPNGEIVVADLPLELVDLVEQLTTRPCVDETTIA